MDYISREDAFNAMSATNLISNLDSVITDDAHRYHRAAERIIASIPSADVIEVIRCKECKYFLAPWGCEFLGDGCRVNKNGYCFFAERREE